MSDIVTFLTDLGLSNTEAQVYIAGLKDEMTANTFSEKLEIKRTTIYHALHTLEDKGLATKQRQEGRLYYRMVSPGSLEDYIASKTRQLEEQQITLEKLLPLFPATSTQNDTYKVEKYDSLAGVKKVVDKALHCKNSHWRIIAPRKNFLSEYDKAYASYYLSKRRIRNIKAKTLWEAPQTMTHKGTMSVGEIFTRNPRYLPEQYGDKFKSVIILFDESIAFISSLQNTEALLITSKEFSDTMGVMFDALWDQSEEFLRFN